MTQKTCTKCQTEKPLSDFGTYKNQKYREGKLKAVCKQCSNLIHKEWVKKNREKFNKYQADYYHKRKQVL